MNFFSNDWRWWILCIISRLGVGDGVVDISKKKKKKKKKKIGLNLFCIWYLSEKETQDYL